MNNFLTHNHSFSFSNSSIIGLNEILDQLDYEQTQQEEQNQLSFSDHIHIDQTPFPKGKVKVTDSCFYVQNQPKVQAQRIYLNGSSQINHFANFNQNYMYEQLDENFKKLIIDRYLKEQFLQRQSAFSQKQLQFNKQLYINRRVQICFYQHVKVSVQLSKISIYKKNSLVLPFQTTDLQDFLANKIKGYLIYDVIADLKQIQNKKKQGMFEDGEVTCVKATGMKNYLGLYFLKTPHTNLKNEQYSAWTLRKGVNNIFNKLNTTEDESIVIPTVQWGTLSQQNISYLMVSEILNCISNFKRMNKCKRLKQIVISLHSPLIFDEYEYILKNFKAELDPSK